MLEYRLKDRQVYIALQELGAVKHKENSKAFTLTMDYIHLLLNEKKRNPYFRCSNLKNQIDYLNKLWTPQELIKTFEFYMKGTCRKYRNIANFIYTTGSNKTHSPLVRFHKQMCLYSDDNLTEKETLLLQKFSNKGIVIPKRTIKKAHKLVTELGENLRIAPSVAHIYGNIMDVFLIYICDKMRQDNFKIEYIGSEKVIQEFIKNIKTRRIVI